MTKTNPGKFAVWALAAIALFALPLLLQATGSNSWVRIVDLALLYVLLALGLNIVVGFAPLKPAEFVVVKLQQLAGQLDV